MSHSPSGGQRLLLVGSSGGHLAHLLALEPWWSQVDRGWVTFDTPEAVAALAAEPHVWWAHHPVTRNVPNLIRNTWVALRVLRAFRPTVIVSAGAGVALPFFVLGRLTGVRTVFIEAFERLDEPSLTGRLCRPFTSLMLVQWPEQTLLYDDAILTGPLL